MGDPNLRFCAKITIDLLIRDEAVLKKEVMMTKLKEVGMSYDQIKKMVKRLDFEKKATLLREVISERKYRKDFYEYTEGLAKKYKIPKMSEEELDTFLHNN